MEANADREPLPASLHDVAAVLIVRHLDHHGLDGNRLDSDRHHDWHVAGQDR